MKDETLDNIAVELQLRDRVGGLARANRIARERIAVAWQSVDNKIAIAGGKQLLSSLSSWSQAEFGVSLSAAKLAASLRREELVPEVVGVVTAVENGLSFGEAVFEPPQSKAK